MALSAAIKAELAKPGGKLIPLLEVDWPIGTRLYAKRGVASPTLGNYKSKVHTFGSVSWSAMDRAGNLQKWSISPTIADESFEISNMLADGYDPTNSPARIKLAHPSVAAASWATICSGIVSELNQQDVHLWGATLSPNDLPLRGPLCRTFFDTNLFDNLPNAKRGTRVPLIGGYHNGAGDTEADGGRVTLIPVTNANPSRHIVCKGPVGMLRVFDGNSRLGTAAWSVTYPIYGGVTYTMVTMTSNRYANAITADVVGYAVGIASTIAPNLSTFTTLPAKLLKHLLVNFSWNAWDSAAAWYADSTAPVDATAFDAFDTAVKFRSNGSPYTWGYNFSGDGDTGLNAVASWAEQMSGKVFWTLEGKLSCSPHPAEGRSITSARLIRRNDIGALVHWFPAADAVSRVQARYNGGRESVDAFDYASRSGKTESVDVDLDFL
jgi:hypothetical protein